MTEAAYTVVDTRTDKVVFATNSATSAYVEADRRDNKFGAVRSRVVRDYDVMSDEEFAKFMGKVA